LSLTWPKDYVISKKTFMNLRTTAVMAGILVALGTLFLIFRRPPEPDTRTESRTFIWSVEVEELNRLAISLPLVGRREAWVKRADRYWYFDQPDGPKVDMQRWGGGIPLLLSGPGAERLIVAAATDKQLASYGLQEPRMKIELTLKNEDTIFVDIGDRTLDGQTYYIKKRDSQAVYTVDHTWYEVLERLVREPPYPGTAKH